MKRTLTLWKCMIKTRGQVLQYPNNTTFYPSKAAAISAGIAWLGRVSETAHPQFPPSTWAEEYTITIRNG